MSARRAMLGALLALLALTVAACGGRQRAGNDDSAAAGGRMTGGRGMMGGGMMGGGMMRSGDTAAAPRPAPASAPATAECPAIDHALVEEGRAVFTGVGNCQTCHGGNAQGTALAPDLTDRTWLNIDGSYGAIATLVRNGVPQPKQHAAPMPPMGGASLTQAQVCAVAAYVYSLSH